VSFPALFPSLGTKNLRADLSLPTRPLRASFVAAVKLPFPHQLSTLSSKFFLRCFRRRSRKERQHNSERNLPRKSFFKFFVHIFLQHSKSHDSFSKFANFEFEKILKLRRERIGRRNFTSRRSSKSGYHEENCGQ
jgi:hypothetical protein